MIRNWQRGFCLRGPKPDRGVSPACSVTTAPKGGGFRQRATKPAAGVSSTCTGNARRGRALRQRAPKPRCRKSGVMPASSKMGRARGPGQSTTRGRRQQRHGDPLRGRRKRRARRTSGDTYQHEKKNVGATKDRGAERRNTGLHDRSTRGTEPRGRESMRKGTAGGSTRPPDRSARREAQAPPQPRRKTSGGDPRRLSRRRSGQTHGRTSPRAGSTNATAGRVEP